MFFDVSVFLHSKLCLPCLLLPPTGLAKMSSPSAQARRGRLGLEITEFLSQEAMSVLVLQEVNKKSPAK